ncbi:MAG: cysteine desulfurase, partial [Moraxellaceae bacterium]
VLPGSPVSAPSSPFYFLGEINSYSAPLDTINGLDEPSPQAFGLPTQADLLALLADDSRVANTGRFAKSSVSAGAVKSVSAPLNDYQRASSPADGVDRVSAQSFNLPGHAEVNQLVRSQPRFTPPDTPLASGESNFYFLDSGKKSWDQPRDISSAKSGSGIAGVDVQAIRRDFPILSERVNGRPLVWFDNAATTHKPKAVIDRVSYFYEHENSNIHRAAHELAARATDAYEGARQKIANFLKAKSTSEIIFTRGTTEAINLLANTYGRQHVGEGDEIIVSLLEHHANIVPWHRLASEVGAKLRVIPVDDSGQILLDEYRKLLNSRTKIVAVTQVSNALGTVTPIKEMIELAHAAGVPVMVDGAQSVSHMKIDVQALDADFFVFSGHKVFGPTGIGVIYGKAEFLKNMQPYQGGGNMIADVTFERI